MVPTRAHTEGRQLRSSEAVSARLRPLLWPGVSAAAMLALLLGLGTWQIQRLHWKQGILAQIARAEAGPAVPLPAQPDPFSKVQVTGRLRDDLSAYYGAEVRDTPTGTQLGTYLIVPLERADGETVLVDRGWVPEKRPRPLARSNGEVTLEGYIRPSDSPGIFSAPDNPTTRQFYTLDSRAIGVALGLHHVAPFLLVAIGAPPPERYPDPERHLPRPPNNHLSYAITWYGLAVALVVIFVLWARKVLSA
jgi:surfeit locus 1 family protein